MADAATTRLTVFANGYRIKGNGSLLPGARITDFMNSAEEFLALTDAEVWAHDGRRIMTTPFMNINRGTVEIVVPNK